MSFMWIAPSSPVYFVMNRFLKRTGPLIVAIRMEESEQDETQQPSPAALLFMFWFVFIRLICFPRSLSLETVRALGRSPEDLAFGAGERFRFSARACMLWLFHHP